MRKKTQQALTLSFGIFLIGQLYPQVTQSHSMNINQVIPQICSEKRTKNKINQETYNIYKENIIYSDFHQLKDCYSKKYIEVPRDLKDFFNSNSRVVKAKNSKKFEELFWRIAKKEGYSKKSFSKMQIKESIKTLVQIICAQMTYCDSNDLNEGFTKIQEPIKNLEDYLLSGKGDCDKYRDLTIVGFSLIKKINHSLKNVYLTNEELGGNKIPHAWVSIVILYPKKIILSQIDPTTYDTQGENFLEAKEGHICLSNNIFKAKFYQAIRDYIHSYEIYKKEINSHSMSINRENWVLNEMNSLCWSLSQDYPKIAAKNHEWVFQKLEENNYLEYLADRLYQAYFLQNKAGNYKKAQVYKERLLKEFPESPMSKWLRNQESTSRSK